MTQTAVDYLYSILPTLIQRDLKQKYQQAKEMEKQQIIDAHSYGQYYCNGCDESNAEQYYNETYDIKENDSTLNSTPNSTLNRFSKIEISDDDIERSMRKYNITDFGQMAAYITGAKWYREKLKNNNQNP